jgi:hypothetical protein
MAALGRPPLQTSRRTWYKPRADKREIHTVTQYERKKLWRAKWTPEQMARHKAELAVRRQLARVYRPLKRGKPLADHVARAVLSISAAEFIAVVEAKWLPGWTWAKYGSTDQGALWNFDHKRAVKHFDVHDPVQAKAVNHWTNLVPMCSRENDRKQHRDQVPQTRTPH